LKKENKDSVMFERKGSLTIGDEAVDDVYVKDLKDNPLCSKN
jgi:hypothetical protein